MGPSALPAWITDLLHDEHRAALGGVLAGVGLRARVAALAPAARALALAHAVRQAPGSILVVTADDPAARKLTLELAALLADDAAHTVLRFPALDADAYRGLPAHPSIAAQRVTVLDCVVHDPRVTLVAPVAALVTPVPARTSIVAWARDIRRGARIDLDELARTVVGTGYRVVDVVGGPGDFARRGGLFDVWPPQEEAPLRVELFGDEVESVRRFDVASQRTIEPVEGFRLLPAREAPIGLREADALIERLVGRARDVLAESAFGDDGIPRVLADRLAGLEAAPRLYRQDLVALVDVFPARVAVWEPDDTLSSLEALWSDLAAAHAEAHEDALPAPEALFIPRADIESLLARAALEFTTLPLLGDAGRALIDLAGRPPRRSDGRLDELVAQVGDASRAGRAVVLLTRTPGRHDRLIEVLEAAHLDYRQATEDEPWAPSPGEIVLADGALDEGVDFAGDGPLILTEQDVFGADPPPPPPKRRRGGQAFLSDLSDLKPDDLVVQVDHGIGRYTGLSRRPVTGEELLVIDYAGGDRLYVPVSRLDLIQKHSQGEHAVVPLDRLGGPGWDRRRQRARKAVESIAAELLSLYATRKAMRAHAFREDTPWQTEFEAAFPHELTPDQKTALADIKGDMGSSRAMDRLLCGDVGYGKTEIALRAAFKALQEGHQIALLAPTTVLAFQHQVTVRARMAAWPVRVEMISRFVAPTDVKRILEATAAGEVDVLIGTHRLLSRDVRFKRLGLLVIDEEQRFGVRHKEAIKQLSIGVHVLALSATPIPRSLQMSLAGVRDLSVIETPPRNRLAIQTHLAPWSPSLVAAAINNELRRRGQVFFITPRVQGIEDVVARLRELVPDAKIAYAHGQMPEDQLERVMLQVVRGEVEVLVATTIIENGLDIPRANTIIVSQAHRFGLSQLYQMRGRVGRSDQRAYAYLLIPPRRDLTSDARRRLAALVEFSELGSGFRIAALDLEIRGAGELLGARQSGHLAAVGFELYVQMLEEAVHRLRGTPLPEPPEPVTLNLGVRSFLPEDSIPAPGQRLEIYKRLSSAANAEEVERLEAETVDRYGRLPEPAQNLFRLARLRLAAVAQGAVGIDWAEGMVAVKFGTKPQIDTERLVRLMHTDPDVRLTPTGIVRVRVSGIDDRIVAAERALERLIT